MTWQQAPQPVRGEDDSHRGDHRIRHGGHGWMMIACCIPMLVIAAALVAAHVASAGYLLAAVACTVMMGADDARHEPRRAGSVNTPIREAGR